MKCNNCGTELNDGAVFCTNCGKSTAEEAVNAEANTGVASTAYKDVVEPTAEKKDKKINTYQIIQLVVGSLFIIIGIIRLLSSSVSISSTSFGADFYTYAYRGIVACAEMLGKLNATISWVIIALGAYIDLKAVKGFVDKK